MGKGRSIIAEYDGKGGEQSQLELQTIIGPDALPKKIQRAVTTYLSGLADFVAPSWLSSSELARYSELGRAARERILSTTGLVANIIASVNERVRIMSSEEYRQLIAHEEALWRQADDPHVKMGVRVCVDAGVCREAIAASTDPVGRSLAGDDELAFNPILGNFILVPSTHSKRIIHDGRNGRRVLVELLIEHTSCGRRGQMVANKDKNNDVSNLFRTVFNNIAALQPEFDGSITSVRESLELARNHWNQHDMTQDGGMWAGIFVKLAQRQAYRNLDASKVTVSPIQVYDKHNGDVIVGLDTLEALTDRIVLQEGGFTEKALTSLKERGIIRSMQDFTKASFEEIASKLTIPCGYFTFEDLQTRWLEVKKGMIQVTENLWQIHDNTDATHPFIVAIAQYVEKMMGPTTRDLMRVDSGKQEDGISSNLVQRRMIHQVFRAFAYAWVLDTFTRGNPPGDHMEDHLASGDSAVLGVKEHLPLGQGDLYPPSAEQFATGYSVLQHSVPGHKGTPVVLMLKLDTSQKDGDNMTTEETRVAMGTFDTLLNLWPYILIGDIVPVIAVRSKVHKAIGRLALSVIQAYGSLAQLFYVREMPSAVYASNSKGELVLVPARSILDAGSATPYDLPAIRATIVQIADNLSDPTTQAAFAQMTR